MDKVFVERDAVIKAVCDSLPHTCHLDNCERGCEEVSAILSVPAADVRPVVRGKWMKNGWSIRCSVCGYDMPFTTRNFCPNCGAMMEDR